MDRGSRDFQEIFSGYSGDHVPPDEFLRDSLRSLVSEFRSLVSGYDPARVIACLRRRSFAAQTLLNVPASMDSSQDVEFPVALVDAAALILYAEEELCVPSSYRELSFGADDFEDVTDELVGVLRKILLVTTFLWSIPRINSLDEAGLNARHSGVRQWIRETSYSARQIHIFDELFGFQDIEALISAERGYSYSDVKSVMEWIADFMGNGMDSACETLGSIVEAGEPTDEDKTKARRALEMMVAPRFEDATFSPCEIADELDFPEGKVSEILEDFSVDLTPYTVSDVCAMLLRGSSPLFQFPLVKERNGRFLIVDESLLMPSIRRNFETDLLSNSSYAQHRGDLLERLLHQALREKFPHATLFPNLKYSLPERRRGEADLLLIHGDVAIIFEAKASTIFKPGEAVHPGKFATQMRTVIRKASKQVEQLRASIELEGRVHLEREEPLDLSFVREVHTVVVTLDELLELSIRVTDLVETNLLRDLKQLPWITSMGDLQLILDLVEEPSEFLVYLRRRRDPLIARKYFSTDELDLFLAFRHTGLWANDLDDAATPARVFPFTGELDDWIHGVTAQKPVIKETALLKYARQARQRNLTHWFEFGAALISVAEDAQLEMESGISKILSQSAFDLRSHQLACVFDDEEPTRFGGLIVFATQGMIDRKKSEKSLIKYLKMKKTQAGVARSFLCVLDQRGKVVDLFYDAGNYKVTDFPEEEYSKLHPLP